MELTSPLTTLASISMPDSYYTAKGSPSNAADETTLSSPIEDGSFEPAYRDALPLPREVKSHCQIHMEEQLYTAAIHILSGLLSDGNNNNNNNNTAQLPPPPPSPNPKSLVAAPRSRTKTKPARVPPPSQLALLATLVVHPSFTSRAGPDRSSLHAAAHALAYLRGLLSIVGPVNANLRAAFEFSSSSSSSRYFGGGGGGGGRTSARGGGGGGGGNNAAAGPIGGGGGGGEFGSPSSSDSDSVGGQFARDQILWRRAPDFWAVLGWAFRCAAEYPHRWRHWRVWLEFMVAVLEADFDERLARDREQGGVIGRAGRKVLYPMLRESLVVTYLEDLKRERKNALREVMRAVFACSDGEPADRAFFREVFDKETVAGRSKSKRKRADAVVDLEKDQFGDYLDGDESDSEEQGDEMPMPSAPRPRRKPDRKTKADDPRTFCLTDGIAESVPFRLRIFRLLSAASYYVPETFVPVDELYETFTDHVRGLPLPMFRLFIEPHPAILPEDVQVSLLRLVVDELLPRHPDPADVDPEKERDHGLSVLMMQECFLPFASNKVTAEDNAKLSLTLESMLWFIYSRVEVEYSEDLRRAVETGIKAREDKVRRRGAASKADALDKPAREALARSARSLRVLVDVIASTGG
ncbi:hypothetical protein VTK56DRAFT_2674 [Thermocarpiscus australiensis]